MYEENKEARGMTYTGLETYVQQAAFDQTPVSYTHLTLPTNSLV